MPKDITPREVAMALSLPINPAIRKDTTPAKKIALPAGNSFKNLSIVNLLCCFPLFSGFAVDYNKTKESGQGFAET
ncbi:MAG: hypothetical protein A2736_01490 [Candidatus Yanofskybacteria bacterium RIFCSPHIGHO2_01_FULL_41_27]|uniref:Uncharacterized protein n=2 Tax=Candidatus Yanofskyibacteriota TaxID=1752733 RepID=A0A1F8HUN6_9BACT|nr:MAG: hypothetical protein A2736_01490 [Candidatus Yanofskybacteria bacterium RIFCSPHIGHO2_01_FULL_41_27]OGN10125.1 MAG: hypothetical protein A3C64_00440 [Candidatus Yanofskybacteria bacterium RIFCSPHIGHO2_02_FULL_41_12]OGN21392.1 MAG: hypothetical protein A3B00_00890 [Candidatus Yanofskybacteria bacterium RIFCSPLOWO2_01_FULL_41_33]OGN40859.1 MAG: hypothetical protein A2606_02575 [Candidatus Yanofskybacteria bacterium RIFOXYD1_FULL_42_10]